MNFYHAQKIHPAQHQAALKVTMDLIGKFLSVNRLQIFCDSVYQASSEDRIIKSRMIGVNGTA
jgi:hypothetical protein